MKLSHLTILLFHIFSLKDMHSVDLFTATIYATLLLNLSDHSDKSVIRNPGDQNTVKGTVSLHGPGWPCYYTNCDCIAAVRPPLNKKLFPVYRPGGSKRADWNFFFSIFSFSFFFFFLVFPLYILVYLKKNKLRKKNSDLPTGFFLPLILSYCWLPSNKC